MWQYWERFKRWFKLWWREFWDRANGVQQFTADETLTKLPPMPPSRPMRTDLMVVPREMRGQVGSEITDPLSYICQMEYTLLPKQMTDEEIATYLETLGRRPAVREEYYTHRFHCRSLSKPTRLWVIGRAPGEDPQGDVLMVYNNGSPPVEKAIFKTKRGDQRDGIDNYVASMPLCVCVQN